MSIQITSRSSASAGTAFPPTVQSFLSGSGTYVTPTNPSPLYVIVEMVGGGGGGGAGSSSGPIPGSNGSNTTFGSSLLTAAGGSGGGSGGSPGTGGAPTVSGPITILALTGGTGGSGQAVASSGGITSHGIGGNGGSNPLGGFAGTTNGATNGFNAITNTGSGGAGAGGDNTTAGADGGGAGAYLKALISSPSSTYSYSVGPGGTGGAASGGNFGGGDGASGIITVTEYYQPASNVVTLPVSPLAFFASSAITTQSSTLTATSFTTFSNSPAFTFTPTASGTYKIYSPITVQVPGAGAGTMTIKAFNASGGASLLSESRADFFSQTAQTSDINGFIQSVYTLVSGTSYVFDIQGISPSGSGIILGSGTANQQFYMFAERVQ